MSGDSILKFLMGVCIFMLVLSVFGCTMSIRQDGIDAKNCGALGGYIESGRGITLCIDSQGRIIPERSWRQR